MANQVSGALVVTANVTAGSEAAYKKLREEIDAALASALVTEIKGATIDSIVVEHAQRTLIGEQASSESEDAPADDDSTEGAEDDPNNDAEEPAEEPKSKKDKKADKKAKGKGKSKGRK